MLTIGMTFLVLYFVPASLISNYKATGNKGNLILYLVTFLVVLVVYGGALFKIMHWPGAGIILSLAIPLPFCVFVPVFLYAVSKDKSVSIISTTIVLLFVAYMGITTALLALNYSKSILTEGAFLEMQLSSAASSLNDLNAAKSDKLQKKRTVEYVDYQDIETIIKKEMILNLNKELDPDHVLQAENMMELPYKDNLEAVVVTVFGDNSGRINDILASQAYSQTEGADDPGYVFGSTPLVFALLMASNLELEVLMKEKEMLDRHILQDTPEPVQ